VAATIGAALERIGACDGVVIACNTASTTVLDDLRRRYQVPIVGVVPAVKWAAEVSQTRQIGVLATAATAGRPYLADLIEKFAGGCRVHVHGAARLAEYAEADFGGEPAGDDLVRAEVEPLFSHPDAQFIDKIALGCTHYPLLLPQLRRLFPGRDFLDPAEAVANRVATVALRGNGSEWTGSIPPDRTIFTAPPRRQVSGLAAEGLACHGVMTI